MRRVIVPGIVAATVFLLVLAGWMVFRPGWAITALATHVEQQLGRKLEVKGGAALEFSPRLAIRLDGVSLANPDGMEGSFIAARSLRVPVGFGGLLGRSLSFDTLELEGAEFALLIDERGETSWAFAALKTPQPLRLLLIDSAVRFFDARTAQAFALSGLNLALDADAEGAMSARGTAVMGGRLARIDAALKSLARVQEDGSPLDVSIAVPDGTASFSGRVSSRGQLGLAGSVTFASPDLRAAARWAGIGVAVGDTPMPLAVSGALESAGNTFAIRGGDIDLAGERAQGEVILDLGGSTPKLQAALATPSLRLAPFLADAGRPQGDWGLRPIDVGTLRAFDADLTVDAGTVTVGDAVMGPARLTISLAGGRFAGDLAVPVLGSGRLDLSLSLDASASPPGLSLGLRGEGVAVQDVLPLVAPLPWLSGTGRIEVALRGTGRTEQEIVGTLGGSIRLSLADGIITGPDASHLLGAVSQRIVEGWEEQQGAGQTAFQRLDMALTLADGIATLDEARLDGNGLSLTASGSLDLLRRAVDLSLTPKLNAGAGTAALPVPVIVRGLWGKPRLYPDLPDILASPAEAFARLKAMGLPAAD